MAGNMEFVHHMQQTVHAEQSAISYAPLRGENPLLAITVNYTPPWPLVVSFTTN